MSNAPIARSAPSLARYESDLYAWSQEQAALLRAGRLGEIDAENIAEEILDVGKTEYRVLESALRVLLTHMLKWDHQPDKRTRSWENTIAIQRAHALRQVRDNPSLKSRREEAVGGAFFDARREASSECDVSLDQFPEDCPYDWDSIMNRKLRL